MASAQQRQMPKDALVIISILKELGITEFEPRVVNQLLEFSYRYICNVLDDAKVYSNHAKKKVIDLDDIRLAVQMQQDKSFTNPPNRDVLLDIARVKNNTPLPLVKPHCGVRLPPDRYCLNSCNYRLKSAAPKKFGHSSVNSSSYGVQQSSLKLGTKSSQLQMVKRAPGQASNITTVPRAQPFVAPKPVIKFTPGASGLQAQKMMVASGKSSGLLEVSAVKMEVDEELHTGFKRKREPDEFETLDSN